ncbi:MAG: RluA family pseudouridine synthase [Candidatus Nanopelagicaceae bacterium]|jgi:23S rRNA pseudouridine1911/1915/1917 synthase|nr:RluA family pseudouridine synthase [Candidatus Nanopelagicaceae bacterium]
MRETRSIEVPEGLDNERIDSALARVLGLSRSVIVKLLESNEVSLGHRILSKSDKVQSGQIITVLLPEPPSDIAIPPTPLDDLEIVYQDTDLVIVNKPVGCAAHPSPGWTGPTVVGALVAAGIPLTSSGPAERQGIVQRLDVGTSGLMMVAKTDAAYLKLKDMFRNREIKKIYHALAQGHIEPAVGTIDAPIDRHPKEDYKMAVVTDGKPSVTHYEVIEYYRSVSLLKVELETGRTHQIRVHMSAIRHPLVGDLTYGADPNLAQEIGVTRPWLHAQALEFNHPISGLPVSVTATYPRDLTDSLSRLSDAVLP